jgi:antitoxin FitA
MTRVRDRRALFTFQPACNPLFPLVISMLSVLPMAQLIVRNIDQILVELLRRRAVEHGRSAEAEHREILRAALRPQRSGSLKDHLLAMPDVGDDTDFAIKRSRSSRVTL